MKSIILWTIWWVMAVPILGTDSANSAQPWFAGSFADEGGTYRYGHLVRSGPVDYDGLLVISDATDTTVLTEKTLDRGGWETILFVGAYADGTLFLILQIRGNDPKALEETLALRLIRIDRAGTVISETALNPSFCHFHNIDWQLILRTDSSTASPVAIGAEGTEGAFSVPEEAEGLYHLQYQGEAFVDGNLVERVMITEPGNHDVRIIHGGKTFEWTIRVLPVIEGIETHGEYTEPVRIVSLGTLFVDGRPFVSGDVVSEPGNHLLEVHGRGDDVTSWPFVLHPTVENIDPDTPVAGPVRVFSNAVSMTLNGIPITQGTLVAHSGFHRLILEGVNGYEREIVFGILPSVQGLTEGGVYTDRVLFYVNGIATLDGKVLRGEEQTVEALGDHVLMLWLGTERTAVYSFTVVPTPEEPEAETEPMSWSWVKTGLGILVLVGLFLVLKKK
ncbi:MAG TPA: hypothetical protein P5154_06855 [Candidatus Izemoplasmatales bacterium]|nr:hypothetical protein [Candidatus Izemoplasmatales bacterium]